MSRPDEDDLERARGLAASDQAVAATSDPEAMEHLEEMVAAGLEAVRRLEDCGMTLHGAVGACAGILTTSMLRMRYE